MFLTRAKWKASHVEQWLLSHSRTPEFTSRTPEFTSRTHEFTSRAPEFTYRTPQFISRAPEFTYRTPQFTSRTPEFTSGFWWSSCCSIVWFLCNVLQIIVCSFRWHLQTWLLNINQKHQQKRRIGRTTHFYNNIYQVRQKLSLSRFDTRPYFNLHL